MQADEVNFDPNIKDCLKLNFDRYRIKKYQVQLFNAEYTKNLSEYQHLLWINQTDPMRRKELEKAHKLLNMTPQYIFETSIIKKYDHTLPHPVLKRSYAASCLIGNKV